VHADGPGGLVGIGVCFDDDRTVCDAGIVLAAALADRLGVEQLVDAYVDLGDQAGAANAGANAGSLWVRARGPLAHRDRPLCLTH